MNLGQKLTAESVEDSSTSSTKATPSYRSVRPPEKSCAGALIVNADDWGRDRETTDRTLDCVRCGTVSSVSAMMFMEDSERAAAIARDNSIDSGLHLNFTSPFSASETSSQLVAHQKRLSQYLLRHRFSQVVFHPGLIRSFEYVVRTQIDEFNRLYGKEPERLDGHHHMHLCANVIFERLLPSGTIVRRNFSFRTDEKHGINRLYRGLINRALAKRHRLTDYFFSLLPIKPQSRFEEIRSLARRSIVEVETHPVNPEEYRFLKSREILSLIDDLQIARGFTYLALAGGRSSHNMSDRYGTNE